MTKEDHAIQGSPVRFASFGPTEWLFVHGGILIAWALVLGSTVLLPPVWGGVLLHSSYNGSLIAGDALIRMVETARGAELELSTTVVSLLLTLSAVLLVALVMLGRRAAREKSAPRGL